MNSQQAKGFKMSGLLRRLEVLEAKDKRIKELKETLLDAERRITSAAVHLYAIGHRDLAEQFSKAADTYRAIANNKDKG